MTSKQRAYLKGLAMTMDPILQLGKGGLTPENTAAVEEALAARELIKISVLQNWLKFWQNVHVLRLFRLLARRLFYTAKAKTRKRKLNYQKNNSIVWDILNNLLGYRYLSRIKNTVSII